MFQVSGSTTNSISISQAFVHAIVRDLKDPSGVEPKIGYPKMDGENFMVPNLIKIHDLGVPLFLETPSQVVKA